MRTWIKRDTAQLDDLRFSSLSADAERTYGRLYMLAGKLDANGMFLENGKQLSADEIAYRIRLDAAAMKKAMRELAKARVLHVNGRGPQIADWKREQVDLDKIRKQTRERVTRYRHGVTRDDALHHGVTRLEEEESLEERVLLLLSAPAREKLKSHPEWTRDAIQLGATKHTEDPVKYAAGILRNWIAEGRRNKSKSLSGKTKQAKPAVQNRSAAELASAREKAKILLSGEQR